MGCFACLKPLRRFVVRLLVSGYLWLDSRLGPGALSLLVRLLLRGWGAGWAGPPRRSSKTRAGVHASMSTTGSRRRLLAIQCWRRTSLADARAPLAVALTLQTWTSPRGPRIPST